MLSIWIANGIDILFGDPDYLLHPVRIIGAYINVFDKYLGKENKSKLYLRLSGAVLAVTTVFLSYIITWLILRLSLLLGLYFYKIINIFLLYTCLAGGCLHKEAFKIKNSLERGESDSARKQLSYIVGRDVDNLGGSDIVRAVVETVSENTGDGIIAPLLYMFIGGAPLAMAYKAINTLDSMVGYKKDKYLDFGRASAIIDDIANYIPSRLSALFMIIAAFFMKFDYKNAYVAVKRDGKKHLSPNSGYPEAAAAGALNISLGGDSYYFGRKVKKAIIGDGVKEPAIDDIKGTVFLMYGAWAVALIFFTIVKYFLKGF